MAEQIKGLSAINDELCAFSDRWKHDGDYMRCRKCSAPQITSCMDMPFPHQDRCKQALGAERHPWRSYLEIIERLAQAAQRAAAQQGTAP